MDQDASCRFLLPSNLTTIRSGEPAKAGALRGRMERSTTGDIQEEGKDLREAAEQTLNVILDVDLDGQIRWVSPSWQDVVGTAPESIKGKPVSDILFDDDKSVFSDAIDALKKDVSGSKIIHFPTRMGELSVFKPPEVDKGMEDPAEMAEENGPLNQSINLEAQGIMIYDRSSGAESHTMWMIRPAIQREVTIDLPRILVESLGDGADMLAHHLTRLAEDRGQNSEQQPDSMPVLCRICERQITRWWFAKHTELCMQEHQAEAALHQAQDNLTEHRNAIVKVLDALEAQTRHKSLVGPDITSPPLPAEYKGMAIGSESLNASAVASPGTSPAPLERRSSGLSHHRARSFVVRRPLSRIVELILDLCDTALEISQPSLKDTKGSDDEELRTQSPQSEGRISQVLHWQSPSAGALEHESGLAALCEDTSTLARAKVDSTMRFRAILEYSERIRSEFTGLVQESIDVALDEAARIAAGESSGDSGDESAGKADTVEEESEHEVDKDEQAELTETAANRETISTAVKTDPEPNAARLASLDRPMSSSFDGLSSMSMALRSAASPSPSPSSSPTKQVSSTLSTQSSSPKSCATPRSAAPSTNTAPHPKTAALSAVESDAGGDSDGSARSSIRSLSRSGLLSSVDLGLPGAAISLERKRTSLILPRERSKTRQESPARLPMPALSPLRVNKPRLAAGSLDHKSPIVSPTMASSEFASPTILPQEPHHRRQSSAASSDISRAGMSPRLTFANAPQPRAFAPSIRDFEIIKPISKGAFGSVYLAKKKSTGDYYAIKAMKKQDMVAKNQVANVKAERAILMFQGESDFVAKLYWTFPSKDYIFLVMEYLNGGDCSSLVQALGSLPEDWAKKYLAEVVLGIEHLHGREIVHRDLKPDNLLIDQKGRLKLTDFGLSRMGLIGRQKRALNSKNTGAALDPLKQGPFQRSVSMTSSRSASFDIQGNIPSPSQTPYMMPVFPNDGSQPSYFSLGRESSSSSREPTRQSSMHQSDTVDADSLSRSFRRFSIYDDPLWSSTRGSPKDEETKELQEPTEGYNLQQTNSNSSHHRNSTPPQTGGAMGPPPMALFDPQDSDRRFVGTPDYLAPETINGLGQDEMSDWWSLGCIMFEFLFGYPPFHAETPDEVFDNILNRKIDWPAEEDETNEVSADARDLMNKLMCLDPSQRLGANLGEKFTGGGEEVRKHPWFADIDWDTLNEAEASFVPAPKSIEDTEYFDSRGATVEDFTTEFDDQATSLSTTPVGDFERPHDALSRVRTQVNSMKRGLMPLHIPPHVRDGRSRRMSEPDAGDDFGQFSFKNLSVLEKANKDVIQKLRAEAMQAQSRTSQMPPNASGNNNSPPSLESSPVIGAPLRRALSTNNRGNHRSASPSTLSHTNSSPSRISQPNSPLVQFSTGERRKVSSGASSIAQIGTSLQPGNFFDVPRFSTSIKTASTSSSPIKTAKSPSNTLEGIPSNFGSTSPRARSHTVGANEIDSVKDRIAHHHKRRSQVIEVSPSSSDTEDPRQKALLRVQRRRQSSRRMSHISLSEGPIFRPLDILIVEDHPVSRLVMEKLVEKLRCRAIIVNDGAEAMRYAMSSVKFDIIMMEYRLPQINGADVARMLRETKNANCHTPIVAVTGYLKELTAPHHFDALVEKPPTQAKLTEVMSRLCQWKPPPPGWVSTSQTPAQQVPMPPSGLRKQSLAHDDSPTSTGSGYPSLPSLSHRASSREDSMSTVSVWTDPDGTADDHSSKRPEMDWRDGSLGGLGISDSRNLTGPATESQPSQSNMIPSLKTHESAPADLAPEELQMPRKVPSAEKIEAKKRSWTSKEQIDTGESGDDEDEELGVLRITSRSPRVKPFGHHSRTSSKLGIEMMRTNSQGTVVDSTGDTSGPLSPPILAAIGALGPAPTTPTHTKQTSQQVTPSAPPLFDIDSAVHASLTPPELFLRPSGLSEIIDMDANAGKAITTASPSPPPTAHLPLAPDLDPTPKASNSPRHTD